MAFSWAVFRERDQLFGISGFLIAARICLNIQPLRAVRAVANAFI